jgi:hypothetical protein
MNNRRIIDALTRAANLLEAAGQLLVTFHGGSDAITKAEADSLRALAAELEAEPHVELGIDKLVSILGSKQ